MNTCHCDKPLTLPSHHHRQVPISVWGEHAHVDEGMAELSEACWEIGIRTTGSCQESLGQANLGFERGAAERFVGAVTTEDLDDPATIEAESLGWRMREIRPWGEPGAWTWLPGGWGWSVEFGACFPPTDIPELVSRLRSWVHDEPDGEGE
jgi:hypothetical protein